MSNLAELGAHGGTALRAFKLNGQEIRRGDDVTAEMLDGLSPRQIRSFAGSGLVKYFTKASDTPVEKTKVIPKPRQRNKRK